MIIFWAELLLNKFDATPCRCLSDYRVQIKYCKEIRQNSKNHGKYLPWLGATPVNFEKITTLDALKIHLWRFFALNEQANGVNIN